ncbi:MAG: UDP-N-acetylglucosamine 2-epimerase (non-hydrolyzing) [Ruminococcaceae bacterium]|nr:UDP-N-acetylglucosamine 2-epimerase (non-hydrolyzing) [Oscillospiraceae bacterium]
MENMSKKIKAMTVFGTRPEAIKMAPLALALEACPHIDAKVCVTAQHRQMLDQVLEIFNITPDYDLDIMKERQSLVGITTRVLTGLDEVIKKEQPDVILVHGDTSTTFAGALAAFYNQTKIGHVEAGLRTYDKYSPFPEEMNRCLTGVMTDFHFSPTVANKNNLLKENIDEKKIYITGNTVIDALKSTVKEDYVFTDENLKNLDFEGERVILVTAHRRENLGEPLKNICRALRRIVEAYDDIRIVYPMHLNPAVREVAREILGGLDRVSLIEPVDVDDLHNAMARCFMVMTDSGGLQEEAPSLAKPVLVLRNETERPEAVAAGTAKIAGVVEDDIFAMAKELIEDKAAYDKMARAANPYGDGNASQRIVDALLYEFGIIDERIADFK